MASRATIPEPFLDLVECPPVAALTTVMPDGYPQTSVVWCDYDGRHVRLNTMRGFQKERNMRRNPLVTLLCYDPAIPGRYLEVRGRVVAMTEDGAEAHLDAIASKYCGRPVRYFRDVIGAEFASTEVPTLCLIEPERVVTLDSGSSRAVSYSRTAGLTPGGSIPESHLDLLERAICAVFTTMNETGRPESSIVWVDFDGECVRVNTTTARRKTRNTLRDPKVSLLIVDPENTSRFLQVRGDAEVCFDGALAHLDSLTRRYTAHPAFYGFVRPADQASRETRVLIRIHARRVTRDAIHA